MPQMGIGKILDSTKKAFDKAVGKAVDGVDAVYNAVVDAVSPDNGKGETAGKVSRASHYMETGDDCWYGRGRAEDRSKAAEWYIDACALIDMDRRGLTASESGTGFKERVGSPAFVKKAGDMFAEGDGVRKDPEVAMVLYAKAYSSGCAEAGEAARDLKARMGWEQQDAGRAPSRPRDEMD